MGNIFQSYCRFAILLLIVSSLHSGVFADNKVPGKLDGKKISLFIINSKGRPVKGAKVYGHFLIRDENETPPLAVSDKNGYALLEKDKTMNKYGYGGGIAYVRYKKTAGIALVGSKPKNFPQSVRLKPACRLFGKITNLHSNNKNKKNCRTKVCIGLFGKESLLYSSKENFYEFFLPEGNHWLKAYGCSGENNKYFTIKPGQKKLEININLKPNEFKSIVGENATDLTGMKGWIGGQEIQLKSPKGKIVLLDFWGHWCGRCIREMPKTMDLYGRYKKYGFEALAIHEGDNISGDQLQIKLNEISKNRWNDRVLNFPVIIDIEDKPSEGKKRPMGPLGKKYRVKRFPYQVLIGRDGKIIKDVPHWDWDFENDLRELLDLPLF